MMRTPLLDPPAAQSTAAANRCQVRILEFADRHPEIRHCVRLRVGNIMNAHTLEGGRHETLVDIVVAARHDRIPVRAFTRGGYVCVELDFGGETLRAFDHSTTVSDDMVLGRLATCAMTDLPIVLAQLAAAWEAGS